ncbi:hypothetical protein [Niallia endozanthoxylica]|uniref:Uncharacterized protein n=1 Tax=Niallia endozanthoxylica TaxID=2036016 RepID=A0A5J5HT30_9BACI|nr:hypothetical protein [Niallia endozanthoxylica]KAA9025699.1 hypothetical protein F4V44_07340 [Niallia endozanthoxylica]
MSKIHTDYVNKVAIMIPEKFIDVKSGESYAVSQKVQEQIEYHADNSTLVHLVMSALTSYLHPKKGSGGGNDEILYELSEIKKMLKEMPAGPLNKLNKQKVNQQQKPLKTDIDVDLKELEEILEAFGG